MVTAKSHELGGQRTRGRHMSELGAGGALALFLITLIPESWEFDAFQQNLASIILTGGFSTFAKIIHESGIIGRLLKSGLVLLVIGSTGCAVQLGTVEPTIHTGADGETIVACDVKGVTLAFGDGGICRNVEGGHVSQAFSGLFTSTVGLAMQAVAGVFGGIGGIGTAMLTQPTPAPLPPVQHPPAIVEEADTAGDVFGEFFQ